MAQKSWKIEEIFPRFVNAQMAKGVSDKTVLTYNRHFRSLGYHLDMTMTFDELTKEALDSMLVSLRKSGVSPKPLQSYSFLCFYDIMIQIPRKRVGINMEKQIKSKKRVADHGEVFTAEREVNAMLDLVKQETERVDSRFLEPACGDGNFLAEILRRKLGRLFCVSPASGLGSLDNNFEVGEILHSGNKHLVFLSAETGSLVSESLGDLNGLGRKIDLHF